VAETGAVPAANGVKAVQLASGTDVFPNLAERSRPVPAGRCAVEAADVHCVDRPASSTRDTNAPLAA
jgi:hypothetical protein